GFQDRKAPLAGPPRREAGVCWVLGLAGRVGVRGGGVGGVFSPRPGTGGNQEPAGRSSGGGFSLCCFVHPAAGPPGRTLIGLRLPDRGENTPPGDRCGLRPGRVPVARSGARSCIALMRPTRFRSHCEGSRDPVAPMKKSPSL